MGDFSFMNHNFWIKKIPTKSFKKGPNIEKKGENGYRLIGLYKWN